MALSNDIDTVKKYGERFQRVPAAADAVAFVGGLLCVNADGFGVAADDTAGLVVVGRCTQGGSNDGGDDGDLDFVAEKGVFAYAGSAALVLLGQAAVGKKCYVVDDETVGVAADSTALVVAGIVDEFDADTETFFVSVGLGEEYSGTVSGADVATVANNQAGAGQLVVYTIAIPDAVSGDTDVEISDKVEVLDFTVQQRGGAGDAGNSYTLKSTGNAISDAIGAALGDRDVARAGEINDANSTVDAGGILRVSHVKGGGTSAALATVYAVKRA